MIDERLLDSFLAAVLRKESCALPEGWENPLTIKALAARIEFHGIAGILYDDAAIIQAWPAPLLSGLRQIALTQNFWEDAHRGAVTGVLDAFDAAGVPVLVMKGTALAYSVYPQPAQRMRGDTDLLIHHTDLPRARAMLRQCGFTRATGYLYQENWECETDRQFRHCIDLHWQVLNVPVLRGLIGVDEAFAESVMLPRLAEHARASDPVGLFLHNCFNQAWHEDYGVWLDEKTLATGQRLMWAMDNNLLGNRFDMSDWDRLASRAIERGFATICLHGVELARDRMGLAVPDEIIARLGAAHASEQNTGLLRSASPMTMVKANLAEIDNWRDWLAYLWIVMFPPREHMQQKYPHTESWPLPALYARRLLSAGWRLRKGRAGQ
jgi:hypothetical protein